MVLLGWTVDKEAARGEKTPERTVKLFRAGREEGWGRRGRSQSESLKLSRTIRAHDVIWVTAAQGH